MINIVKNFESIKKNIPVNVKIIAVSKTKTKEKIIDLYNIGHRDFGENRIQEMKKKYEELPKDKKWHMKGHLQTNKV